MATASYRGENIRTMPSPVVRSVNKTRDIQIIIQNELQHKICVVFTTFIFQTLTLEK